MDKDINDLRSEHAEVLKQKTSMRLYLKEFKKRLRPDEIASPVDEFLALHPEVKMETIGETAQAFFFRKPK